ncbi:site-specific DNA-methyltransferase [Marinovum sp. 2_MG-2023]|uniref:site-specific DNA-methyltransferase n=1 Tax=unclassified Marinovum TaxID=2647166 RepID=UPI0026E1D1F0|nr:MULTISPECIES: site-specific DNA-methyltransferase [unclassified Marinovum]MDO6732465.1 site-specific DNA-methyltransferase [Marinovum sp. 2_MG-2023]MDO6781782.1 site-specific DNA-methyltransferase [Marinovum sp. 1_MG-2023]
MSDEIEKLKMHSPDLTQDNIAKIKALFPGCVTEARDEDGKLALKVDFDQLRQELSDTLVEGPQERYHLNWPGKREALITANAPIAKTLRPVREESVDFDTTQNLFIEGDNLEALKLLQETYLGKVKMIYIDPPYNTGSDFVYEDDFNVGLHAFESSSGERNDEGSRLVANTTANGRFHSDWLSMLFPRLKLARSLMASDGIIAVSIDDNEATSLGKVLEEVFGAENFVDCLVWKKRYGGGAKEKFIVGLHEYVFVYARDISNLDPFFVPLTDETIKRYYTQQDEQHSVRGPYRLQPLEAAKSMGERKNLVFPVTAPDGTEVWPKRQWLWARDRVEKAILDGELEFNKSVDGEYTIHSKQYLKDKSGEMRQGKPLSVVEGIFNQHGSKEIEELFGNSRVFPYPKPSDFIRALIEFGTQSAPNQIILDFFAGSGSSAHATFKANSEDGRNRQIISVQIPEECDPKSDAAKEGYATIAEISKERIRRAGQKILEGKFHPDWNKDIGFRVLKIDSSNMADVFYTPDATSQKDLLASVDNIKPDRTPEDLLFQVLVDWGVDLTLPISSETIDGKTVFSVAGTALMACFDDGVDEALVKKLAEREPMRVVFKDTGFKDDATKINVRQIFKSLSPDTEVKAI